MNENNSSSEDDKNGNNSQPAPGVYCENGNDSQPAPGVPQDKKHRECIEEILSLENLFSAPLETKNAFEVIKMHNGNEDSNYARIFFGFNKGCSDKDIKDSKHKLESVKNNGGEINDKNILKNVKRVVVDRTKIDGYSQGKGNDEIIFNEDNELISVYFVKKPENNRIKEGEGLRKNTVHNKVMVLRYVNKYRGTQEFIVDMDNNLIITTDNLRLYWHSKDDNAGGNGFDDDKTPVYISSSKDVPIYNHFRINNDIKFKNAKDENAFYQTAMKQLSDNKLYYGISYIYNAKQCVAEGFTLPESVAGEWARNVSTFVQSQVKQFNNIIQKTSDREEKRQKIQTFCNSFKDYLLGHKKIDDVADKKDNKKYDNIIMVSNEDYKSVDEVLSVYKVDKKEADQEKVNKIIYPVFEQITNFIERIKKEVKEIEEQSTTQQKFTNIDNKEGENNNVLNTSTIQQHSQNDNYGQMKIETDEQEPTCKCDCGCDFGLPDCLTNFLGK